MPVFDVAIVDYEMGNLFSISRACENAGMKGVVTSSPEDILSMDAVILPGVGAYGDAMECLKKMGMDRVLCDAVGQGKPVMAICLGMQLLMSESHEFGIHKGLDIIKGSVLKFDGPDMQTDLRMKVPQVGWNNIYASPGGVAPCLWEETPLDGLDEGEFMYFVHSFYVNPGDSGIVLSYTRYGEKLFCSSFMKDNVFACQFHPERSGEKGLKIYHNFRKTIEKKKGKVHV